MNYIIVRTTHTPENHLVSICERIGDQWFRQYVSVNEDEAERLCGIFEKALAEDRNAAPPGAPPPG